MARAARTEWSLRRCLADMELQKKGPMSDFSNICLNCYRNEMSRPEELWFAKLLTSGPVGSSNRAFFAWPNRCGTWADAGRHVRAIIRRD